MYRSTEYKVIILVSKYGCGLLESVQIWMWDYKTSLHHWDELTVCSFCVTIANILVSLKAYCYIFYLCRLCTWNINFFFCKRKGLMRGMKAKCRCYFGNVMVSPLCASWCHVRWKKRFTSIIGSSTGELFTQIADGYMCSGKEILTWKVSAGLLRWLLQHTVQHVCETADETVCENTGAGQKSTNPAPPHRFIKPLRLVLCHQ